jgi:hypothetical protein
VTANYKVAARCLGYSGRCDQTRPGLRRGADAPWPVFLRIGVPQWFVEPVQEVANDSPKVGLTIYLIKPEMVATFENAAKKGWEVLRDLPSSAHMKGREHPNSGTGSVATASVIGTRATAQTCNHPQMPNGFVV